MTTIGLASIGAYVAILATKFRLARRYAAAHREEATLAAPVTILQPILSGDPLLGEMLRRNVSNAPAEARFVWLVDEDDAGGRQLVDDLVDVIADPRIDVVLCPPAREGENPKSAKLERGLARVATPYVAVLDDDTVLSPSHLGRALHALEDATLYTGLPCYLDGPNVWSSLVSHFVDNNSILTYLPLLRFTGALTINGMFYVMRTADLRAMGGFAPIVSKLCDDYALAALVRRHGGTIRQGVTPQFLRTTVPDAIAYQRIMRRWFRFANVLLRDQTPRVQALLVLALGIPPLLFAASFLSLRGGVVPASILAAALVLRHALLRLLQREVFGTPPRFHPLLSIVSELLQPLHWLDASIGRTIRWRTRRIALRPDGSFSYVGGAR